MSDKNVIVVIGGQFGSEAKGKHIQDLCHSDRRIKAIVRTGAPNAGHSMAVSVEGEGDTAEYVAMQILPCGWTAQQISALYVGAGAQILTDLLMKEYKIVNEYNNECSVYVDPAAMIQTVEDADSEFASNMSGRIGSTGKGCGAALIRRISRKDPLYEDYGKYRMRVTNPYDVSTLPPLGPVSMMINEYKGEDMVLVEGTQGCGLSMYHGHYPYCTSRETGAANWLAEAGLSPLSVSEVHMVCRTYPIRVAGDSGPMKDELCWSFFFKKAGLDKDIIQDFTYCKAMYEEQGMDARELMKQVCVTMQEKNGEKWAPFKAIIEFTTVTKLPRRIGMFDYEEFENAVIMNRPTHVALEFCNYVTAEHYGITQVTPLMEYVCPVSDAGFLLHGEISCEKFCTVCTENVGMTDLLIIVERMNEILNKHDAGKVTHLGISRNTTLMLI